MPLLIDTYNVLHTVGVLPPDLAGIDVMGLIALLNQSRYANEPATLVRDGWPQPGSGERPVEQVESITIRYSGHGTTADDLISQLIRASTAPRRLIVISSDNAVLRSARRRKCRTLTSAEFLQQLVDDARPGQAGSRPKPAGAMTEAQVDRWVNLFKLDPDMLAIDSRTGMPPQPQRGDTPPAEDASQLESPAVDPPPPQELPAGPVLPPDLIEQAERLWSQHSDATTDRSDDRSDQDRKTR